jgi:hypothetical protein
MLLQDNVLTNGHWVPSRHAEEQLELLGASASSLSMNTR